MGAPPFVNLWLYYNATMNYNQELLDRATSAGIAAALWARD